MKILVYSLAALCWILCGCVTSTKEASTNPQSDDFKKLFMDVHNLKSGKVTMHDVMVAHQQDVAIQEKYDVNFLTYWVDESEGKVFCLAKGKDSASVYLAHRDAHGYVPDLVEKVLSGSSDLYDPEGPLFFDVHRLGPGNINFQDIKNAHLKDLAVQNKYDVHFINYWVDEKMGIVMCLAEAADSTSMINTHREAHGLAPDEIYRVLQGN